MKNNGTIVVFGHKGASSIAPENTIESFQKAIELKADFIEFDLRLSKDHEIVVIHDENTLDLTGHNDYVNAMTLKELKELNVGNSEKIPTLIEVIGVVKGKINLHPEIKVPGLGMDLINILQKNKLIESSLLSCFDIKELLKIKEIEPKLKLAYLIPQALTYKRLVKRYLQRAIDNELFAIHPYHQIVDRDFVKFAHANGLKVNVWTVNDEIIMKNLVYLGVDGIMTDDIALLNQVLGRSY